MSGLDDDNRFSRCVAEYRREQSGQITQQLQRDNRFECLRSPINQRQQSDNRFECLRDDQAQRLQMQQVQRLEAQRPEVHQRQMQHNSRSEYESSNQRLGQQLPYREYESVNTIMKRLKESGELQIIKWDKSERISSTNKGTSQDIRKVRSKTMVSIDDREDFPALTSKSAPVTPATTPLITPKQMIQSSQQIETIVLPPKESDYVALYYEGGKLIKKPVYKDAEGNSTYEAPLPQIIEIKKPSYNKWSDLLK